MTPDTHPSQTTPQVTTVQVGRHTQVIVLRGAIRGDTAEELREQLLQAIDAGARELFLDLSQVESISSSVHDLVAAASITLADRGGALLAWSQKYAVGGEPTYVIADIRDRAIEELMPRSAGEEGRKRGRS